MSHQAASLPPAAAPRVAYRPFNPAAALAEDVLAAVVFGNGELGNDPRFIRVGLEPLYGAGLVELWWANGPVRTGREGFIRYAADVDHLFGVLEIDERLQGGIAGAAEAGYAAIRELSRNSEHPHLLRVWNHFNDINGGEGDAERYRQFCVGRAAGLGDWLDEAYPAATAIGRRDGDPTLQVYWLAGRAPGVALENPRQVNPYRYPRTYGPISPQFSRGMLASNELAMISGTASIVGHASHHKEDLRGQLDESLANLHSVLQQAATGSASTQLNGDSLLKIYLRDATAKHELESALRERLASATPFLILAADIRRADLLVEVDCVHGMRRAFRSA
jgi:chorismate lyase/3-hydroxybenzoate synthase